MSDTNPSSGSTDIGVLVVHGIGNQRRNATLDEFDDALVGSLRRWLGSSAVDAARRPDAPAVPAHARVTIDVAGGEPLRALVAEGHWADTVRAPSSWRLLTWLFSVVPFVVPRALDGGLRRSTARMDERRGNGEPRRLAFAAIALGRLAQNLAVVGLTIALLLLLSAVWVLALPRAAYDRLRGPQSLSPAVSRGLSIAAGLGIGALSILLGRGGGMVSGVGLSFVLVLGAVVWFTLPRLVDSVLANYIGDCYALLTEPDTERDMVGRVEGCLSWLEAQVGDAPVVIVAHSQGTEIARRVLVEHDHRVRGFVTLGSAIAKLGAVDDLRSARGRYGGAFGLRVLSAGLLVLAAVEGWRYAGALLRTDGSPPAHAGVDLVVPLVLLAGAAVSFTAALGAMRRIVDRRRPDRPEAMTPRHVERWVDFYTRCDPVPEGALPIAKDWGNAGCSREIVNCRLALLDHVRYWSNVQGFCATVALELGEMAGRPRDKRLHEAVASGARERARLLAQRVRVRGALALAAISAVIAGEGSVAALVVAAATIGAAIGLECVLARRAETIAAGWSPCAPRDARREAARQVG